MRIKVQYTDGTFFIGERNAKSTGLLLNHETPGTHHFIVSSGSLEFRELIGKEIAVPVSAAKYFVLNYKEEK